MDIPFKVKEQRICYLTLLVANIIPNFMHVPMGIQLIISSTCITYLGYLLLLLDV